MPGLLKLTGFETSNDWWEKLPDQQDGDKSKEIPATDQQHLRQATVLGERLLQMERVAEERLAKIHELDALARHLQQQCIEKESVIQNLVARRHE
jgi:hypothetical protein